VGQAHQVEFRFRVQAAQALGLVRRQHAVGAHHAQRGHVAHDQVVAVGIEHVDVQLRHGRRQARAHFLGKDLVAQALGFDYFVLVARPRHAENRRFMCRCI
jgi:hypothetical protein